MEKQKLENTVKERTREIWEKNLQLKDQSEKLKEMDKVKSRFFANISHAFRTPLTLIMSPLEQMISQSRDKQQKKEFSTMLRSSQWLLILINQLLDLARFDNKEEKLRVACQNIVPFLKSIIESFQTLARQNRLEMEFLSNENEIDLYFEPQKMEEVIGNHLINAIKLTPPGGKITVSVSRGQQKSTKEDAEPVECVKILVQDTGTGIAREQMVHIFDRFYQAGGMKENLHKGTGIGLALTKEIVELHGGTIDVHSQEGEGTKFVVLIPLGNEHLKPGEVVFRSEIVPGGKKAKEIETLYLDTDEEAEETNGNETGKETDKENRKQEKNVILVVEDHADVRKYIRGPLVEAGYDVVEATDGKEGIARAREIIPDLIVSDIMMPEVDGYELCQVLKKDINTSHIPIIMLTAKASEDSIIEGFETGADDYVTKPFNTRILITRIKNLIELRRQMQLKIQRKKMLLPVEIPISSMDETFLQELQDAIEENLSDPEFNIEMLYEKLYIGRTTLFRKVEALTGETPNQFIKSYRLERAAQLLKKNFGNITEVAFKVGFQNPQYFSQCFKEKFHQSPSSFKASESN
jgi:DNA-binding response OmpR family regulator/two-component sensor histidine kinase